MHLEQPSSVAPIGVLDSGIGGLSVLQALQQEMPDESYVYLADNAFAPYGERSDDFVADRTLAVADTLRKQYAIKALVVACNTATAAAIHLLRAAHPDLPIIGVEPAIRPALAHSRTRRIGVIATRGTVSSAKFRQLLAPLQTQADFVVQPCDGLALAIEATASTNNAAVAAMETEALCARYISAMGPFGDEAGCMDTLVLGCTHYVFASETLRALVGPDVRLIETGAPVARQTRRLLDLTGSVRRNASAIEESPDPLGRVVLHSTGDPNLLALAARRWVKPSQHSAMPQAA